MTSHIDNREARDCLDLSVWEMELFFPKPDLDEKFALWSIYYGVMKNIELLASYFYNPTFTLRRV